MMALSIILGLPTHFRLEEEEEEEEDYSLQMYILLVAFPVAVFFRSPIKFQVQLPKS